MVRVSLSNRMSKPFKNLRNKLMFKVINLFKFVQVKTNGKQEKYFVGGMKRRQDMFNF